MSDQRPEDTEKAPAYAPRRDGLADERDDRQAHPYDDAEARENAETSTEQPSEDVG